MRKPRKCPRLLRPNRYVTSTEIILVIAAAGTFVASLAAAIVSIITAAKMEIVRHATNSLTDRLVQTTKTEAHAAGVKEGEDKSGKS